MVCALDKNELERKAKLRSAIAKKAMSRSRRLIEGSAPRIERAAQRRALRLQKKKKTDSKKRIA